MGITYGYNMQSEWWSLLSCNWSKSLQTGQTPQRTAILSAFPFRKLTSIRSSACWRFFSWTYRHLVSREFRFKLAHAETDLDPVAVTTWLKPVNKRSRGNYPLVKVKVCGEREKTRYRQFRTCAIQEKQILIGQKDAVHPSAGAQYIPREGLEALQAS
jgi:hypothetical protein